MMLYDHNTKKFKINKTHNMSPYIKNLERTSIHTHRYTHTGCFIANIYINVYVTFLLYT